MEVLRRCPLAIAQRLVHWAIAVSTAVLDRVTTTMSVALLLMNNLDNSKQKTSNLLSQGMTLIYVSMVSHGEEESELTCNQMSMSP